MHLKRPENVSFVVVGMLR